MARAQRKRGKRRKPCPRIVFKREISEKGNAPSSEKPKSAAETLQTVVDLVRACAEEIAKGLIEQAKSGELAHARYLYELARIHPASPEATESRPEESPTYKWLTDLALRATASDQEAAPKDVGGEGIL